MKNEPDFGFGECSGILCKLHADPGFEVHIDGVHSAQTAVEVVVGAMLAFGQGGVASTIILAHLIPLGHQVGVMSRCAARPCQDATERTSLLARSGSPKAGSS